MIISEDLVSAIGGPQSISAMNFGGHRTMSILSDDSFMSAFEDLVSKGYSSSLCVVI